jgi:hypothetical protein
MPLIFRGIPRKITNLILSSEAGSVLVEEQVQQTLSDLWPDPSQIQQNFEALNRNRVPLPDQDMAGRRRSHEVSELDSPTGHSRE